MYDSLLYLWVIECFLSCGAISINHPIMKHHTFIWHHHTSLNTVNPWQNKETILAAYIHTIWSLKLTIKWSFITISSMYLVSSSTLRDTRGAWEETTLISFIISTDTDTDAPSSASFNQDCAHQGEFQRSTRSKHKDQLMSPASPRKEKRRQINKDELCKAKPGVSVLQIPNKDESHSDGWETDSCRHLTVPQKGRG